MGRQRHSTRVDHLGSAVVIHSRARSVLRPRVPGISEPPGLAQRTTRLSRLQGAKLVAAAAIALFSTAGVVVSSVNHQQPKNNNAGSTVACGYI
ncbi:uncharacterized protein TrAFT101_000587 [Trichoderma asperellum]|uniref:uncharacterized protein n=1 Tax=Trichoderma asperellum TaxID=101201 RepID=UPI003320D1E9|nr:hypothetical protein TrAFT101_000587 [Trichoderma asperellum]